jgi:hypothetical protein
MYHLKEVSGRKVRWREMPRNFIKLGELVLIEVKIVGMPGVAL